MGGRRSDRTNIKGGGPFGDVDLKRRDRPKKRGTLVWERTESREREMAKSAPSRGGRKRSTNAKGGPRPVKKISQKTGGRNEGEVNSRVPIKEFRIKKGSANFV